MPPSDSVLKPMNAMTGGARKKKTLEETYQKKTQREHILLRPDTYVGSVEKITDQMYVVDDGQFALREITYVPGLYKIFDEIIVNAADNKQRDPDMDKLEVTINPEKNEITVYNTGRGIPIQMHSKEQVYIPELIFGHLLTSSNYDDNEKKVTGGRNGYGAKLCNIFSTYFKVETSNGEQIYTQVFKNNMTKTEAPKIKDKQGLQYTKITFRPDLAKFGMESLDADIVALMSRRVYDIAGTSIGIRVKLNGTVVKIKDFKSYVTTLLAHMNVERKVIYQKSHRWEVCLTMSENGFQQMSFVNSIATTKGGTHVDLVMKAVLKELEAELKKKKRKNIKSHLMKGHVWVFVNCLIENPSFDSQTKENMTRQSKDFGSKVSLTTKFVNGIKTTGIIDAIIDAADLKSAKQLARKAGGTKKSKLTGIPKLDDANEAGTRNSHKCTLILTEGDSAKALAVSGLGVVGRDYYGVFPLRGKLLNVRDATNKQIMDNSEIKNICQIMGLKFGQEYTTTKSLRYGSLMIMTDQDQDGSHIKGLLINFIHKFWPSLLQLTDFLVEFVTPIVKATKGRQEKSFFTIPQYEHWVEQQTSLKGWRIKYYKGLGTSTRQEAKQYFSHMDDHQIPFSFGGDPDFDSIDMAFSKKRVNDRKEWLRQFVPGTYLDHDTSAITYTDFINKELILFSMADNVRSIPSVVDGFKPGQRKILFSCFKRNLKDEIKVAQLAGYVSEHSAYHHGEQSLAGTIINMAQNFVGSNNINILLPKGQFGTRLQGGKDAASPRYIFTDLSKLARKIFVSDDDDLYEYLEDDGQSIEPTFYVPILPMVLVNGSDGIGTGWSSSVPNYNPRDIVNALTAMLDGEECPTINPWYLGFDGEIASKGDNRYAVKGKIEQIDDNTLEITELPIRTWTQPYKEFLEGLSVDDDKKKAQITEFTQHHTDTTVKFVVTLSDEQMAAAKSKGLVKVFKLESSLSTSNLVLFDSQQRIKKYDNVTEILQEFYDVRLKYYQKRKALLAEKITNEYNKLDNKVRFIMEVISGTLVINNRKKKQILADLHEKKYKPFPKKTTKAKKAGNVDDDAGTGEDDDDSDANSTGPSASDYDYLLGMPMWNLTLEKVQKLTSERNEVESRLNTLLEKTPQMLWKEDLSAFVEALAEVEAEEAQEELDVTTYVEKNLKKGKTKRKARKSTAKKSAAAATKTAEKKKASTPTESVLDMSDDDDDGDDWMPDESTATKAKSSTAAKPKKVTKKKAAGSTSAKSKAKRTHDDSVDSIKSEDGDGISIDDDESDTETSSATPINLDDDVDDLDDDDDYEQPKKTTKRASGKKASAAATKQKNKKGSTKTALEKAKEAATLFDFGVSTGAKTAKGKKAAPAKKKATTAAASKKAASKTGGRKKKVVVESEDEEDDNDMSDGNSSEDDQENDSPVASRRRAPARRGRGRVNYAAMMDDEEDEDGDGDGDDDNDVSLLDESEFIAESDDAEDDSDFEP